MELESLEVINECTLNEDYPFMARASVTPKVARKFPHLRFKTHSFASLCRFRHKLSHRIREFFNSNDFFEINTPIITSNDCEGAGEVFQVSPANPDISKAMIKASNNEENCSYFDTNAYLTVSAQLHLEAAANGLCNVYSFNPAFRAEMGRTRRHLSEFLMIEAESAFMTCSLKLRELIQRLLRDTLSHSLQCSDLHNYLKYQGSVDIIEQIEKILLVKEFPTVTFQEAFDICERQNHKFEAKPSICGFAKEHELFLCEHFGGSPLFIVEWPENLSPFYSKYNGETYDGVDLLFPRVGELVGGSIRENDASLLENRMEKMNIDVPSLKWYLDLRKFGCAPSGGFGLGFERLIQFILGVPNIRDTIPFPRSPHNYVQTLRVDHRLVGNLIGVSETDTSHALPLVLLPEEIDILVKNGSAHVVNYLDIKKSPCSKTLESYKKYECENYLAQIPAHREKKVQDLKKNLHKIVEGRRKKSNFSLEETPESILEKEISKIKDIPKHLSLVQTRLEHVSWTTTSSDAQRPHRVIDWTSVYDKFSQSSERNSLRRLAFSDLYSRGFFITEGSNFGAEFLVYPGDPSVFHARYILICEVLNSRQAMVMARLGNSVNKTVLAASLSSDGSVIFKSIQWSGKK